VFGGDQAYRGQGKVIIEHAPRARDFSNRRYWRNGVVDEAERTKNRTKSKVRAKVEHAFFVIKRVFGFARVLYRGLDKNAHRLFVTCARQSVRGVPPSAAGARGVARSARVKSGRCPEATPKGACTRRTRAIDCRRSQQ
jgi:Transposase DDE domain